MRGLAAPREGAKRWHITTCACPLFCCPEARTAWAPKGPWDDEDIVWLFVMAVVASFWFLAALFIGAVT